MALPLPFLRPALLINQLKNVRSMNPSFELSYRIGDTGFHFIGKFGDCVVRMCQLNANFPFMEFELKSL